MEVAAHFAKSTGGVEIAYSVFNIGKQTLQSTGILFAHATEMWIPVVEELSKKLEGEKFPFVTAVDLRGHGDSSFHIPPEKLSPSSLQQQLPWNLFAKDILSVAQQMKEKGVQRLIGVGLSKGASSLAIAELEAPNTFETLVLIEPILSTPGKYYGQYAENSPMAEGTMKRRQFFPSIEEAINYFKPKEMTKGWTPKALESYTKGVLKPSSKGGFELKCHPYIEAEVYKGGMQHKTWEQLPSISANVILAAGADSNVYSQGLSALKSQFKKAKSVEDHVVPNTGHFLPLQRPDIIADLVLKVLNSEQKLQLTSYSNKGSSDVNYNL